VADYLTEEIKAEGIVRSLGGFARFLDAMAFSHGEITNFANIARDCGVDAKTVRSYYDILVDTLLGRFVPPFAMRTGRQSIVAAEKFYLFDVGIANYLCKRVVPEEGGEAFGRAFEHFILMELWAYRGYAEKNCSIRFWRTKAGLEVDFILGDGEVAIEVKGASRVDDRAIRSMKVFMQECRPKKAMVVCRETTPRVHEGISILPWRQFLQMLWAGEVM
jgi:predicted AAA+ superfamily ATPase